MRLIKLNKRWMEEILETLKVHYGRSLVLKPSLTPFEMLIKTILSQNTTDLNANKAFNRLRERFKVEPKALARADLGIIRECIKVAGLGNIKAKRIKEVSMLVYSKFGGDLSSILSLPLKKARSTLIEMPGIGYKTADVILTFAGEKPIVPIDTHLFTVGMRLGVFNSKRKYEAARESLEKLIPAEKRAEAHLLLLAHGKAVCTAKRAWCSRCPISKLCMKIGVTKELMG
ncbi:MAG: endonuclease III [Candidatus Bathyarchaeia archaeon]